MIQVHMVQGKVLLMNTLINFYFPHILRLFEFRGFKDKSVHKSLINSLTYLRSYILSHAQFLSLSLSHTHLDCDFLTLIFAVGHYEPVTALYISKFPLVAGSALSVMGWKRVRVLMCVCITQKRQVCEGCPPAFYTCV